jgi:hypothetical protein
VRGSWEAGCRLRAGQLVMHEEKGKKALTGPLYGEEREWRQGGGGLAGGSVVREKREWGRGSGSGRATWHRA